MITALTHAALSLLLAATADAALPAALPTIHCVADTVRADDQSLWTVPLIVHNPLQYSLTPDSMFVDITVLDRGVSRAPRRTTLAPGGAGRAGQAISSGDDSQMALSLNAIAEHARIVVRYYAHDGQKHAYALSDSMLADGGVLTDQFPSAVLHVNGREVEIVPGPAPGAAGTVPGLLLVPGEASHARGMLGTVQQYSQRGYNVVAVSPPGYGTSSGPADFAGPATLAALEAALTRLRDMPGTDPHRVAVWGNSRGANAALLLAAKHPDLAAVVAQEAVYDLWAAYRAANAELRADILTETGADSAAWRARSPLMAARDLRMPVLVVQNEADAAARAFLAVRPAGAATDTLLLPAHGTPIGRLDPRRAIPGFLRRHTAR